MSMEVFGAMDSELEVNVVDFLFLDPTTENEVFDIINKSGDKAGGIDNINMFVIRKLSTYLVTPLTHIFNKCILSAAWPKILKQALIIPIHTDGKKCTVENYRPISLLPNFAKIFEKIVHSRIYNFLSTNKVFATEQKGFQKHIGTEHALAAVTNYVFSELNIGNCVLATSLDIRKAFDTISHERLFKNFTNMVLGAQP